MYDIPADDTVLVEVGYIAGIHYPDGVTTGSIAYEGK